MHDFETPTREDEERKRPGKEKVSMMDLSRALILSVMRSVYIYV